ncbi:MULTISPECIES: Hok/Gef family protein [Cronobacter]|uniref:Hok/Gef family protein n=1 Tax=Cronobacter TaxID=413496 RepID=UPI0002B27570|nr:MULTISPECIES: Hok/Gef family protein [Cronobacter]AGE88427.1 putative small toxic membrane polypeptide, Putative HokE-like protein [Cronobacter sakazakii SP291]
MPIKSRYAFLSILALCITVLCFALIMRDRLCEFTIKEGSREIRAILAYEPGK